MVQESEHFQILTAVEVANYVVCPEAWRLKRKNPHLRQPSSRGEESRESRDQTLNSFEEVIRLKQYAKVVYLLLVAIVTVVFILEQSRTGIWDTVSDPTQPRPGLRKILQFERLWQLLTLSGERLVSELYLLLVVVGIIIVIWDLLDRRGQATRKKFGLKQKSEPVAAKGSSLLSSTTLQSSTLGLESQPHAVTKEGKFLIPIDIVPLSDKVRDRHVIHLLCHLKLIAESSPERPAFGVLLMGKERRRVQIPFSPEKELWLDTLLDEMRSILDGVPAVAKPARYKCEQCDVRKECKFSAFQPR